MSLFSFEWFETYGELWIFNFAPRSIEVDEFQVSVTGKVGCYELKYMKVLYFCSGSVGNGSYWIQGSNMYRNGRLKEMWQVGKYTVF